MKLTPEEQEQKKVSHIQSFFKSFNVEKQLNDDDEIVVELASGWTLRSGVYDPEGNFVAGEYIRLCDTTGLEIYYWDVAEWEIDPALVMGAIVNAAALSAKYEKEKK